MIEMSRRERMELDALPLDAVAAEWPEALECFDAYSGIAHREVLFLRAKKNKRCAQLVACIVDDAAAALPHGTHGNPRRRMHWHAGVRVWARVSASIEHRPTRRSDGACCERPSPNAQGICERCGIVEVLGYRLRCASEGARGFASHPITGLAYPVPGGFACHGCVSADASRAVAPIPQWVRGAWTRPISPMLPVAPTRAEFEALIPAWRHYPTDTP